MPKIRFSGVDFDAHPSDTILKCLREGGARLEHRCSAGVCQACAVRVVRGPQNSGAQTGLSQKQIDEGVVLSCQQKATDGLVLEEAAAVPTVDSVIVSSKEVSPGVLRILVRPEQRFDFQAGQFIHLIRPQDGVFRPYSIANLPGGGYLELHVQVLVGGELSPWLAKAEGQKVQVRGPYGACTYPTSRQERRTPLILAATGTGGAPLLGVLRQARASGHRGPVVFLHAARDAAGLYLSGELQAESSAIEEFRYAMSVTNKSRSPADRTESLPELLKKALVDVANTNNDNGPLSAPPPLVYLCGNEKLVQAMRRETHLSGISLDRIRADAFTASVA